MEKKAMRDQLLQVVTLALTLPLILNLELTGLLIVCLTH
jgi:hypothetical protein